MAGHAIYDYGQEPEKFCVMHVVYTTKSKFMGFSHISWDKYVYCASKWKTFEGCKEEKVVKKSEMVLGVEFGSDASDNLQKLPIPDSKTIGFHSDCYKRFTDVNKIERARKKFDKLRTQTCTISTNDTTTGSIEHSDTTSTLAFCEDCGALRVRDVTEQLQKLFADNSSKPNVCGICRRLVDDFRNDLKTSVEKSSKSNQCKTSGRQAALVVEDSSNDIQKESCYKGEFTQLARPKRSHGKTAALNTSYQFIKSQKDGASDNVVDDNADFACNAEQVEDSFAKNSNPLETIQKIEQDSTISVTETSDDKQCNVEETHSQNEAFQHGWLIASPQDGAYEEEDDDYVDLDFKCTSNGEKDEDNTAEDDNNGDEEKGDADEGDHAHYEEKEDNADENDDEDNAYEDDDLEDIADEEGEKEEEDSVDSSFHQGAGKVNPLDTILDKESTTAVTRKTDDKHQSPDAPFQHKRSTRLSTGAIKAAKYESMLSVNDCSNDDEDYNRSKDDFKPGDSDASDLDSVISTEESTFLFEREIEAAWAESEASAVMTKTTDSTTTGLDLTKSLDPELLELMVPSDDLERPFKCKFCNNSNLYLSSFQKHVKIHTGKEPMEKPYKCPKCGKNFAGLNKLLKHHSTHAEKTASFKCKYNQCKFAFSNKHALRNHFEVHKGIKRYQCETCGAGFARQRYLAIHQTGHSDARPFSCKYCHKTFSHRDKLRHHERGPAHENANRYKCEECQRAFGAKYRLRIHKLSHQNRGSYECKRCKYIFKYKTLLANHVKKNTCKDPAESVQDSSLTPDAADVDVSEVDVSEVTKWLDSDVIDMMGKARSVEMPFRCKHCSLKEFQKVNPFLKHMRQIHPAHCLGFESLIKRLYRCNQCDSRFGRFNKLQDHLQTHSDERQFVCQHAGCNKAFNTKSILNNHQQTHKARHHMCSTCGSLFICNSKLKRHEMEVHLNHRPYKCTYCSQAFPSKARVSQHESRVHLKLKPCICEVCGKSFATQTDLNSHARHHTGEKPFSCEYCEYRCIRRDYLRKHLRIHTGEKPHQCSYCGMPFALRTSLTLHMKKQHGTEAAVATFTIL